MEQRADLAAGRLPIEIEEGSFTLADHMAFLEQRPRASPPSARCSRRHSRAERTAWAVAGEFDARPEPAVLSIDGHGPAFDVPFGGEVLEAPLSASIWRVEVRAGDVVRMGQRLLTLEAMKMETPIDSPLDGEVVEVLVKASDEIVSGSALVVLMGRGPG